MASAEVKPGGPPRAIQRPFRPKRPGPAAARAWPRRLSSVMALKSLRGHGRPERGGPPGRRHREPASRTRGLS